jgi:hypothetical protein
LCVQKTKSKTGRFARTPTIHAATAIRSSRPSRFREPDDRVAVALSGPA